MIVTQYYSIYKKKRKINNISHCNWTLCIKTLGFVIIVPSI